MLTKEQILAHKQWSKEEKEKIENCFTAAERLKKPCKLSECTLDNIEAEVAKRMNTKSYKSAKKSTISKKARKGINEMLKKAKELGFKDEEIADAIKAMIQQRAKEEFERRLKEIEEM